MDVQQLFLVACGYEDTGEEIRVFLDSPTPEPSVSRKRGQRASLFHLFAGEQAEAIREWLSRHKAWQVLRVPPDYTKQRGIAALRVAHSWSGGSASPLFEFASTRRIDGEEHRERLRAEVEALIGSLIENPVNPHDFPDLQLVEDVVNTAPLNAEPASFREVWAEQAG
jgi:hypothetical protein